MKDEQLQKEGDFSAIFLKKMFYKNKDRMRQKEGKIGGYFFFKQLFHIQLYGSQKIMVSMNYPEPDEKMKINQFKDTSLSHI